MSEPDLRVELMKLIIDSVSCPNCSAPIGVRCKNPTRDVCNARVREAKKKLVL